MPEIGKEYIRGLAYAPETGLTHADDGLWFSIMVKIYVMPVLSYVTFVIMILSSISSHNSLASFYKHSGIHVWDFNCTMIILMTHFHSTNECVWYLVDNTFFMNVQTYHCQNDYAQLKYYIISAELICAFAKDIHTNHREITWYSYHVILLGVLKNASPYVLDLAVWLWEMADGDPPSSAISCNAYGTLIIGEPWWRSCGKVWGPLLLTWFNFNPSMDR